LSLDTKYGIVYITDFVISLNGGDVNKTGLATFHKPFVPFQIVLYSYSIGFVYLFFLVSVFTGNKIVI
jgi:hypothetical protein